MITQHTRLGDAIKEYRLATRLSPAAFADLIGVVPSRVASLELSADLPSSSTLPGRLRKIGIYRSIEGWALETSGLLEMAIVGKKEVKALVQSPAPAPKVRAPIPEAPAKVSHEDFLKAKARVEEYRAAGYSQARIASIVGTNQAQISLVCVGKMPSSNLIRALVKDIGNPIQPIDYERTRTVKPSVVPTHKYFAPVVVADPQRPEVKRENPKPEIHTVPRTKILEKQRMERPELPKKRPAYSPQQRSANPSEPATPWIDPSTPIIPVAMPDRKSRGITVITPEYEICTHCNGLGKHKIDEKVAVKPIDSDDFKSKILPHAAKQPGYEQRQAALKEKQRASEEAKAERANRARKVEYLGTAEIKELALQNRTRVLAGMSEITLSIKDCLSCGLTFQTTGNRQCKTCRRTEAASLQGLDVT